jgi:O-acetylserine/cysteine efflux transporter
MALKPRDFYAALAIVLIWGMNFVAMRFALHDFTPFQLGAARFTLAAIPLVFIVRRPDLPWRLLLAYGLLQGVGQFGFLFTALAVGMSAALASVLMQTQVFFTALIGWAILGERISKAQAGGLGLAATGLVCFAVHFFSEPAVVGAAVAVADVGSGFAGQKAPVLALQVVTLGGFVLNLCAAASWAAANVAVRRAQALNPNYDALGFVVWTALVPILPFVLMSAVVDPVAVRWRWLDAGLPALAALAYLAWVATIWAYAMWTGLLKRHPANRVAPFTLGVPVVGLSAGMLILSESISPWQWAGAACVLAAMVCAVLGGRWLK